MGGKLTKKMRGLLEKLVASPGGRLSANDGPDCEIGEFCDDGDPDTFNKSIRLGLVRCTHNFDTDNSIASITPAGRAALQAGTSSDE